jgi:hypothetical protein
MAELPAAMLRRGRGPDPDGFAEDESLYRAFEPDAIEGQTVAIDAIELPDLSVNRGKHGPPGWLLLLDRFEGCGVAEFHVRDFPKELLHNGQPRYTFDIIHDPTDNNYPHSVIRAFDNGVHITDENKHRLEPDVHLRWRNRLRQRIRVRIPAS